MAHPDPSQLGQPAGGGRAAPIPGVPGSTAAAAQPVPGAGTPGRPAAARPIPASAQAAASAPTPLPPGAAPRPVAAGSQQPRPAAAQPVLASRALPGGPIVREPLPDEEGSPELEEIVKRSPPWLLSGIIHMLLLIIMGLWMFAGGHEKPLMLEVSKTEEMMDVLDDTPLLMGDDQIEVEDQAITLDNLPEVEDPYAVPPPVELVPEGNTLASDVAGPIGLALLGRSEGMKKALLGGYGGTPQTEKAVLMGLEWLMRNQRRDGSWSLTGPYSSPAVADNIEAATAMALLAFQGAGHTHMGSKRNPFTSVVDRGWKYLLKSQDREGNFFHEAPHHHTLYTHAQATIALCELYALTKDPKLKQPAEKAVAFCLNAQDAEGGWRYNPRGGSDTSVTGWFVMALQSARMAGFEVPQATFDRVMSFLDRVTPDGGRRYGYMGPSEVRPSMTAEALLCRQYIGWKHDDERLRDGVAVLLQNPITWNNRNAYYWYYATQVCHHMEGDTWTKWNNVMRETIPKNQISRGNERGSWDPEADQWGQQGGRLFVTCLHLYMLEVYYRHLPIYQTEAILKK